MLYSNFILKEKDNINILNLLDKFSKKEDEIRGNAEFECKFNNRVDIDTFRRIVSRMKGLTTFKGYNEIDCIDSLDIIIQDDTCTVCNNIRRTIYGMDTIMNYYNTNECDNFEDVYKKPIDKVYVDEYNLKFNLKYEIPVGTLENRNDFKSHAQIYKTEIEDFDTLFKQFRRKKRFTFYSPNQNVKIDLTIVNSSRKKSIQFKNSDIYNYEETYEIEIELNNENSEIYDDLVADRLQEDNIYNNELLMTLYKNISYILQVIDGSDYIIPQSEKHIIITNYIHYMTMNNINTNSFISPKPVSFGKDNFKKIQKNYSVTDKADGEGQILYIPGGDISEKYRGKVYLINNINKVIFTGICDKNLSYTVLNGEFIRTDYFDTKINTIYCYDAYFVNGIDITSLKLFDTNPDITTRLVKMNEIISKLSTFSI